MSLSQMFQADSVVLDQDYALSYVTCIDMYRQKRTPASHVFVLMISSEQRRVKPYAIPIQCLPYTSMDHTTMR